MKSVVSRVCLPDVVGVWLIPHMNNESEQRNEREGLARAVTWLTTISRRLVICWLGLFGGTCLVAD